MILFYKEMVVVLLNKKFKFIVIFGTLQVQVTARWGLIKAGFVVTTVTRKVTLLVNVPSPKLKTTITTPIMQHKTT